MPSTRWRMAASLDLFRRADRRTRSLSRGGERKWELLTRSWVRDGWKLSCAAGDLPGPGAVRPVLPRSSCCASCCNLMRADFYHKPAVAVHHRQSNQTLVNPFATRDPGYPAWTSRRWYSPGSWWRSNNCHSGPVGAGLQLSAAALFAIPELISLVINFPVRDIDPGHRQLDQPGQSGPAISLIINLTEPLLAPGAAPHAGHGRARPVTDGGILLGW